jgi:phage shock protein C
VEYFEQQAFGVCAWWGNKLGMRPHRIRMSFIYLSFITFGSPVLIYLIMAFILENKTYFKIPKRRSNIWDLE